MPAGRRVWVPKKTGELVTIPFNFAGDLAVGETILSAVVTASVYTGIDASPSGIIFGTAGIFGTDVNQDIQAGIVGVIYGLLCRAVTSLGQTLEQSAFCYIETNLP
jgi:hypothetical protein